MNPTKTLVRTAAATAAAMAAASLTWISTSGAAAAATPSAELGAVTCADQQGRFVVTLEAGAEPTGFSLSVSNSFERHVFSDDITLDADQTGSITVPPLDDDEYSVTVHGYNVEDVDEEIPEVEEPEVDPAAPLVDTSVTVACDPAPVGPYSNPRGVVYNGCGALDVYASNRPIGGNTADLQPVEFTLTFVPSEDVPVEEPTEEPTDEPTEEPDDEEPADEEPGDEPRLAVADPVVLDTFTLDATTPFFHKTYEESSYNGTATLSAEGRTVSTEQLGSCVLSPTSGVAESGGAGLPNTGA